MAKGLKHTNTGEADGTGSGQPWQFGKITCYLTVPKGVHTEDAARLFLEGHRKETSKKILSCLANITTFYIVLY